MSNIILTHDQSEALNRITTFLTDKNKYIHILAGSAGTGKSFLTKEIINGFKHLNICCIVPTHKAKEVLLKMISPVEIKIFTIASILGKLKEHSYIGTKAFTNGNDKKMHIYKFFIIDEISMVSDIDLSIIINYVKLNKKKLLCVGDQFQIPSPSQKIIKYKNEDGENVCYKADSMAFYESDENMSMLEEIVRQQSESYIIKLATKLRDNIKSDVNMNEQQILTMSEMLEDFSKNIKLYPHTTRCITYTNKNVYDINIAIRDKLFKHVINDKDKKIDKFYEGEVLMAYNTLGYPTQYIENGNDYIIKKVTYTTNYEIDKHCSLSGHLVKLINVVNTLFFIKVDDPCNKAFIENLVRLANIVNSKKSSKIDFIKYSKPRNEVVFLEDLYSYQNKFYGRYEFKKQHSLLFTKTIDVINIDGKTLKENYLTNRLMNDYDEIVNDRLNDDKIITENETFADKFMVIEKDIDYAYTITSHKSQGSTYDSVYVYDDDFNKLNDRYNHRYKCIELRTKEKNQLRYVAYTRARYNLALFTMNESVYNE